MNRIVFLVFFLAHSAVYANDVPNQKQPCCTMPNDLYGLFGGLTGVTLGLATHIVLLTVPNNTRQCGEFEALAAISTCASLIMAGAYIGHKIGQRRNQKNNTADPEQTV